MAKKITLEEFYAATGKANANWQSVEDAIFDVFSRLILISITGSAMPTSTKGYFALGTVFYGSTNIRARIQVISTILASLTEEEAINNNWKSLSRRIDRKQAKRNVIAHGIVYGNEEDGASCVSQTVMSGRASKALNFQEVLDATADFEKLTKDIQEFSISMNKQLVSRNP